MTPPEAELLLDFMRELWPDWKRSAPQEKVWLRLLTSVGEAKIAREALERTFENGKSNNPRPREFKAALLQICPPTEVGVYGGVTSNGMTKTWVVCTAHPKDSWLGAYAPLCYCRDDNIPDHDTVMKHAYTMAEGRTKMYGGEWTVYDECTTEQVFALRYELRGALVK